MQSLWGEVRVWGIGPFSNHKNESQSSCGGGQRGMMREGLIWGLCLWSMAASVMIGPPDSRWPPVTSADEADRHIRRPVWTYTDFLGLSVQEQGKKSGSKLSFMDKTRNLVFSLRLRMSEMYRYGLKVRGLLSWMYLDHLMCVSRVMRKFSQSFRN